MIDAIVVGAGPNGLSAAILLAKAGYSVQVYEGHETVGGGTRSAELTLPGFLHDICSAIHPLAVASPFFRTLPLADYGLEWITPPASLAHPLDDGRVAIIQRDIDITAAGLGEDAAAYRKLIKPVVENWDSIAEDFLGPFPFPPRHPLTMAAFGLKAIRPAASLARGAFRGDKARGLFAGMAGHSMLPLESPASAAFGLVMGALPHVVSWPLPRGGSQKIADALAGYLRALGGEIFTGCPVESLNELPEARAYLLDVSPRGFLRITRSQNLPAGYRRRLERYRYGVGVFKIDYALDGPIPWKAAECSQAATVHLGGTLEEIAASERAVWNGHASDKPFVLLAQPSLFDASRAPQGKHTAWVYCHVPNGYSIDMTQVIERQIERFAPGFCDRVLERHIYTPANMEAYNPNYVGGDINGGVQDLGQLFTRPVARLDPYTTPDRRIFICSSSTPPGGGVHGMCGFHAARSVIKRLRADFRVSTPGFQSGR
jgi:phytoene dehydrogenase-like protein